MSNPLFRKNAIENLSQKLDEQVKILNYPLWLICIALIIVFITLYIWGFTGSITSSISLQGVMFSSEDVQKITANTSAIVQDVILSEGDTIERGSIIAVLHNKDGVDNISDMKKELS